MKYKKGDIDRLGEVILFLMIVVTVLVGVVGISKMTVGYTCDGATRNLINDLETSIKSLDQNTHIGTIVIQPNPLKIPSCVICVHKDGDNLKFDLDGDNDKELDGESYYDYKTTAGSDILSCENSGLEGGKKYQVTLNKDSISNDPSEKTIEIKFDRTE